MLNRKGERASKSNDKKLLLVSLSLKCGSFFRISPIGLVYVMNVLNDSGDKSMNTIYQALSLAALMVTVMISWWFDQQFLTQSFMSAFSFQQVSAVSILIAGVFACGRVLCYAWLGHRKVMSGSQIMVFLVGAMLLTGLSFIASTCFVSKSLDNPYIEQAVAAEQARIKQQYQLKRTEISKREHQENKAINARFDIEVKGINNSFKPLITAKDNLMADEAARPYKTGPNKGSSYGPDYRRFEKQRNDLIRERNTILKGVASKRSTELKENTKWFTHKREVLIQEESQVMGAITPAALEDSKASQNPFFTSTLKSASSLGLSITYNQLVVCIALAVAAVIELMTFGFTASYMNLRKPTFVQDEAI